MPTHSLGNDDDRKRFETEAKAAAALNHPNIATVHQRFRVVTNWVEEIKLLDPDIKK